MSDKTQPQMLRNAQQKSADRNSVFLHIQGGANPLTDAEIERLIARNPDWEPFKGMGNYRPQGGAS